MYLDMSEKDEINVPMALSVFRDGDMSEDLCPVCNRYDRNSTEGFVTVSHTHLDMSEDLCPVYDRYDRNRRLCHCLPYPPRHV